MTLTINHLAPYISHNLCIYTEKYGHITKLVFTPSESTFETSLSRIFQYPDLYKPILRPLSDLTVEITHRGEAFVPIEKMIKEYTGGGDGITLTFYPDGCYFYAYRNGIHCVIPQGKMINKLREWMFDLDGLIDQNLAIDVNTLTENPYEK